MNQIIQLNHQRSLTDALELAFPGLLQWPNGVIIFCNYRTGSTALGNLLGQVLKLKNLGELQSIPEDMSNRVIFNLKPDYYKLISNIEDTTKWYCIKLTRSDIAAQITSLYISSKLGKYNLTNEEHLDPYSLDINILKLDSQIQLIKDNESLRQNYKIKYNVSVDYETIKNFLISSEFRQFPKPKNYNEIYTMVKQKIELQG